MCCIVVSDVYSHVNFQGLQICPHFADFEFTNWTRNGEVHCSWTFPYPKIIRVNFQGKKLFVTELTST